MQDNQSQDKIEMETKSNPLHVEEEEQEQTKRLTKTQKQRIISILFGRLLNMHKSIMIVFTLVHVVIIIATCFHMFIHGTIESENKTCYITWPLMHLFYAFLNYLIVWLCGYNACEITGKKGHNVLVVTRKFLKVLFLFSFTPIPLKYLSDHFCRNWTYSWQAVFKENIHIIMECILLFIYFTWFEKKYSGFKIFYKDTIF